MKKLFITMMVAMIAIAANAQYSTNFPLPQFVMLAELPLLHRICHQILTAYEAENGNVVVFVKNS